MIPKAGGHFNTRGGVFLPPRHAFGKPRRKQSRRLSGAWFRCVSDPRCGFFGLFRVARRLGQKESIEETAGRRPHDGRD